MWTVATVGPNHRRFVAVGLGERIGATERLGPIRGEAFGVPRVEPGTECMAHDFVRHHTLVPSLGQTTETIISPSSLEDARHQPNVVVRRSAQTTL